MWKGWGQLPKWLSKSQFWECFVRLERLRERWKADEIGRWDLLMGDRRFRVSCGENSSNSENWSKAMSITSTAPLSSRNCPLRSSVFFFLLKRADALPLSVHLSIMQGAGWEMHQQAMVVMTNRWVGKEFFTFLFSLDTNLATLVISFHSTLSSLICLACKKPHLWKKSKKKQFFILKSK